MAMSGENHADSSLSARLRSSSMGEPGSMLGGHVDESNGDFGTSDGVGFGETEEEDGEKAQARSERKRSREKKRRSDVNTQFGELTRVLKQIESEESSGDELIASRLSFPSATNRVDLIARTIAHLESLHRSNKRRKLENESLQKQLEEAKKAGEETAAKLKEACFNPAEASKQVRVLIGAKTTFLIFARCLLTSCTLSHANLFESQYMMMVPMMMSQEAMAGRGASMAMMNPFMAPQAFFPTPFPSAAVAPRSNETLAANSTEEQKLPSPPMQLATPSQPAAPSMIQQAVPTPMSMAPMGYPPMMAMQHQQHQQQTYSTMPFMMTNPIGGMAPVMTAMMPSHGGQQSSATGQSPMSQQSNSSSSGDSATSGNKGQDNSGMGGANLAHCA